MTEYWLISAPGEKTCQQTWEDLNKVTSKVNLSANHKFHIPDLKVRIWLSNYRAFIPRIDIVTVIFRIQFFFIN